MIIQSLILVLLLFRDANGHGNVLSIQIASPPFNSSSNAISNSERDLQKSMDSFHWRVTTNSAVKDVTSDAVMCNVNGNGPALPTNSHIQVDAGSKLTLKWTPWHDFVHKFSHHGPIINYMAFCGESCANFNPQGEKVWFKIDQTGFISMEHRADGSLEPHFATWDLADLYANQWSVTIPKDIKPGKYLLRHELFALHLANKIGGAELYPNCFQLDVRSNGNASPSDLVAFPGAYSAKDPGILFNLYAADGSFRNIPKGEYTIPGPPVYKASSVPRPLSPISQTQSLANASNDIQKVVVPSASLHPYSNNTSIPGMEATVVSLRGQSLLSQSATNATTHKNIIPTQSVLVASKALALPISWRSAVCIFVLASVAVV